jgi:DNA-binding MarR family transcriptional regulator
MPSSTDAADLAVFAARLVRALRRLHETPAGLRVLSLLDELGPSGISALAAADRSSQPTMSGAVTQLVESGWVTKVPNPHDARGSVVELTAVGRRELARLRALNGAAIAERLAATTHTAEDLATAVAVLRDVLDTDTQKGLL